MSLTRQFFRELRPLFRMLDEPFATRAAPAAFTRHAPWQTTDGFLSPFAHDLFGEGSASALRPALDVSERADAYVVEADLPGVQKEHVRVRVGDGGRTLTIEGETFVRSREPAQPAEDAPTTSGAPAGANASEGSASTEGMLRVFFPLHL